MSSKSVHRLKSVKLIDGKTYVLTVTFIFIIILQLPLYSQIPNNFRPIDGIGIPVI